jgi:hypothetical protein
MFKWAFAFLFFTTFFLVSEEKPQALTWPRVYSTAGAQITVHQPQITDWKNYTKLHAESAIEVNLAGVDKGIFGALYFNVETKVNVDKRLAALENLKIAKIHFPNSDKTLTKQCQEAVTKALSNRPRIVVSMDRLIESANKTKETQKSVDVNYEAPNIFYSEGNAILINILGPAKFKKLADSGLEFCINTNWDIILDPATKDYYLFYANSWLKTKNLKKGPWTPAEPLPKNFRKIPDTDNWQAVINAPIQPARNIPQVFFSESPAELIVSSGKAKFKDIPQTSLAYLENSKSDILFSKKTNLYYYLITGRWFQAAKLDGKWESALKKLPDDFKNIPDSHPKDHLRAAVAGTDDAEAALLMASIPKKATVQRTTTVKVTYEGEPKFVLIKGTNVEYAVNTSYDVFKVKGTFYCCHKGVWFTAASPTGTWAVAIEIPKDIYDIPSSSPKHHVTYVFIDGHTTEVVYISCTSGYYGCYVSHGVIVYGSGYSDCSDHDDHWCHYHYYPWYYSYGCGIRVDYYKGDFYRGAHYYGPYGGAGGWAAYNPDTGTYKRGGFVYGPNAAVKFQRVYNPDTGWRGAGYQAATPYNSWGKGVVSNGEKWVKAGYKTDYDRGTVAGFKASDGSKGIAFKDNDGNKGAIVKDKNGNVYVGKDGEIYRKGEGGWEKRGENGSWAPFSSDKQARTKEQLANQQKTRDIMRNENLRKPQDPQINQRQKQILEQQRLKKAQDQQRYQQHQDQRRKTHENLRRQSLMRQRSNTRSSSMRTRRR